MLAYPLPEAEALLDDKLQVAQGSLANCQEDLDFLREQITVCYSWYDFLHVAFLLMRFRPWRLLLHEFTIGTWASDEKRIQKKEIPRTTERLSRKIEYKSPKNKQTVKSGVGSNTQASVDLN